MNKKLENLGDALREIRVDASVYIGPWAVANICRLLRDLPPETTVQEIVDTLESYE